MKAITQDLPTTKDGWIHYRHCLIYKMPGATPEEIQMEIERLVQDKITIYKILTRHETS